MLSVPRLPRARIRRLVLTLLLAISGGSAAYFQLKPAVDSAAPTTLAFDNAPVEPGTPVTLASDAAAAAEAIATDVPLEGDCSGDEAFCIGIVTGLGRVDDQATNQLVWDSLAAYEATSSDDGPHLQVDLVETARVGDLEANIGLFSNQHYDVIVTVGSDAAEATRDAADQNPDTRFVGVDQQPDATRKNYVAIPGSEVAAGSAAVALAATASQTGVVGVILPTTNNAAHDLFLSGATVAAQQAGVELVVEHQPTTRSGPAATWAPPLVQSLIEQDVDVVAVLGVADSVGVLDVIGTRPELLCIGHGADRWLATTFAHHCLVTSIEIGSHEPLIDAVASLRRGEAVDGYLKATLGFAPFRPLESVEESSREWTEADRLALEQRANQLLPPSP
ncbi:MAG: BMP family ABC transporter substrate-binding protein [Acidimicrobiales bacterium]